MTLLALETRNPALDRLRHASPLLWNVSLAFLAAFVICLALAAVDPRVLNGTGVWVKPAKFYLSLALHMLTMAFAVTLLPDAIQRRRGTSLATGTMASMAILEQVYITWRASRAEASHFNASSPLAEALYSAMGMGAALMMVATAWIGLEVLRHGPRHALVRATGSSFILAAALTLVIGFTLGSRGSHWIGGDLTDATGLPVLGWSTTGGDLRPAHFLGLHVMQLAPLAAWLGGARLALLATAAATALCVTAYAMALMGLPLIHI